MLRLGQINIWWNVNCNIILAWSVPCTLQTESMVVRKINDIVLNSWKQLLWKIIVTNRFDLGFAFCSQHLKEVFLSNSAVCVVWTFLKTLSPTIPQQIIFEGTYDMNENDVNPSSGVRQKGTNFHCFNYCLYPIIVKICINLDEISIN